MSSRTSVRASAKKTVNYSEDQENDLDLPYDSHDSEINGFKDIEVLEEEDEENEEIAASEDEADRQYDEDFK